MNNLDLIRNIISEKISIPESEIDLDSKIEDFDSWDSMQHLAIIMEVESRLDCSIPFDKVVELKSVQDLVDAVNASQS